jgi:hypothetical protein
MRAILGDIIPTTSYNLGAGSLNRGIQYIYSESQKGNK